MEFEKGKLFYSIKEIANKLNVSESLLRYWEKKFSSISPARTAKGIRQYRLKDVDEIRLIYYLVKEKGMTLSGAQKKLKDNRDKIIHTEKIINCLKDVRAELASLKTEFDELDKLYGHYGHSFDE
ncbi:MAG: MerR family transcriptional regulator [Candidatus Azobacteroides pseudotrichonymphae]|jgi:DNA-binding transcriptional MerR regulator|uniref:HTH-type transcriptional regulator n=1 Tax=Azobacteroides pseudotrichonymphae genomovar. CFP2 TaxID=511995 RepID=B6YRF9_AZOPC|nr:MerR family transcriptional regulator [Candidatus Azobacteroides pseudotrichonymphae]MDR0530216.1 MerR family transcriptional regulator [Bacteroidales bacterium OttesenSCG-928-I14]BAG83781.1 HTH-type transcriptional regulator [Candidatus Azobacteroides pseudotrichonymphae genomovar. CFP2]GMO35302.1 MAG: MerR family transcriptional regulator [Candidatus Azobacteroides pseudotrichonymphae]